MKLKSDKKIIIIDGHQDVIGNILVLTGKDIRQRGTTIGPKKQGIQEINQVDIPRLKRGKLTAACWAICSEEIKNGKFVTVDNPLEFALNQIDFAKKLIKENSFLIQVLKVSDILQAKKENRFGVILAIEGAPFLGNDLAVLTILHKLGIRVLGLTWNKSNSLADGAADEFFNRGLTKLGEKAVKEMNRLGITIDVAHLNQAAFKDVLKTTIKPVICSHSNPRYFCDHSRLLSDEQIKALARNGGVIGLSFVDKFLGEKKNKSLIQLLDQIDHIVNIAGIDHIGIGSDFDGIISGSLVKGLEDVTCYPRLIKALMNRGYNDKDIKKIMGENLLRVLCKTWEEHHK